jgi:hypothetical protein
MVGTMALFMGIRLMMKEEGTIIVLDVVPIICSGVEVKQKVTIPVHTLVIILK